MAKQEGDRPFAGQLRRLRSVLIDPGQVDVWDEVVGIGALEHEHLDLVVGLGALDEGDQIANQRGPQQVHRRGRNFRDEDGLLIAHCDRLENHGISSAPGGPLARLGEGAGAFRGRQAGGG